MERWKDVNGYEGVYQISDHGRLRSLDRYVRRGRFSLFKKGCEIVLHKDRSGYHRFRLRKNGAGETVKIHRLVAEHFLNSEPGKKVINHKDFNKTNNHYLNLEWCTVAENNKHYRENEKVVVLKALEHGMSKLNIEQILTILTLPKDKPGVKNKTGFSALDLANLYSVHPSTIHSIRQRRSYTEATGGI